jgi:hypothetical protein
MGVEAHILTKVKNSKVPPEDGTLQAGSHNLSPGTLEHDWQYLLKVTTKDNRKATKGSVRVTQIPKGAINCLHVVTMHHGCLIPNDQVSVTDQSSEVGVFGDGAEGGLMNRNRDLEA